MFGYSYHEIMSSALISILLTVITTNNIIEKPIFHAVYISVLELNKEEQTLKIKIFENDLKDAIFSQTQERVSFSEGKCYVNKSIVESYLSKHLQLLVNNQPMLFTLQRCELNETSLWLHFSLNAPQHWQKLHIKADYLMELFPTQSNVVSVLANGKKSMFRLTKGHVSKNIEW